MHFWYNKTELFLFLCLCFNRDINWNVDQCLFFFPPFWPLLLCRILPRSQLCGSYVGKFCPGVGRDPTWHAHRRSCIGEMFFFSCGNSLAERRHTDKASHSLFRSGDLPKQAKWKKRNNNNNNNNNQIENTCISFNEALFGHRTNGCFVNKTLGGSNPRSFWMISKPSWTLRTGAASGNCRCLNYQAIKCVRFSKKNEPAPVIFMEVNGRPARVVFTKRGGKRHMTFE